MSECYPHVARRRDRIEPAGECTYEEGVKRLRLLTELLGAMSTMLNRPGLLSPHAIDSIGTLLCPPVKGPMAASNPQAEHFRLLLVNPQPSSSSKPAPYPRVRLQLRTHETISVEAAETLESRQRLSCLAIRGTDEMARRLDPQERALSDLTIELDARGTTLVVRQQRMPLRAVVVLMPGITADSKTKPKRNVLEVTLPKDQGRVLSELFEGSGKGRLGQLRSEPLTAVYMSPLGKQNASGYYLLPTWMTEHLATMAQNLFRLQVLSTAAVPFGRSRMLYFDRASVHRNDDPRFYKNNEHTTVRCSLHTASSACVCPLHRKTTPTPFRLLEFNIEMCGAAFEERDGHRCCPRHSLMEPQESTLFPGMCTHSLKVEVRCCHERKVVVPGSKPPPRSDGGLRIDMTDLLRKPNDDLKRAAPGAWMLDSVRDLAACACAMATSERAGQSTSIESKGDADAVMAALDRECLSRGHTDAQLGQLDETAVWMLRLGGGEYCRRVQKMEVNGKRKLPGDPPDVALTHGHLFKVKK